MCVWPLNFHKVGMPGPVDLLTSAPRRRTRTVKQATTLSTKSRLFLICIFLTQVHGQFYVLSLWCFFELGSPFRAVRWFIIVKHARFLQTKDLLLKTYHCIVFHSNYSGLAPIFFGKTESRHFKIWLHLENPLYVCMFHNVWLQVFQVLCRWLKHKIENYKHILDKLTY